MRRAEPRRRSRSGRPVPELARSRSRSCPGPVPALRGAAEPSRAEPNRAGPGCTHRCCSCCSSPAAPLPSLSGRSAHPGPRAGPGTPEPAPLLPRAGPAPRWAGSAGNARVSRARCPGAAPASPALVAIPSPCRHPRPRLPGRCGGISGAFCPFAQSRNEPPAAGVSPLGGVFLVAEAGEGAGAAGGWLGGV